MFIKTFIFNPIQENTYVVIDEKTSEGVIIDAGCLEDEEKQTLADYIRNHNITLKHVLNTHLHMDHCFGNFFLYDTFGVGPEAHADEASQLPYIKAQSEMFGIPFNDPVQPLAGTLSEGDVIHFGESSLQVIAVPGHSKGGLAFYSPEEHILFAGDSLFRGSIGRTDLPGGNYQALMTNLIQKIMILPSETEVYSGHGPVTTIGDERDDNPYLQ